MSEQPDEVAPEAAEPPPEDHRGEHNEIGFFNQPEEEAETEAPQPRPAGHQGDD